MTEHDWEPVRGLPGRLPEGEHILWQGEPEWRMLWATAFRARLVAIYFGLLIVGGLATGSFTGAGITVLAGLLCLGLLALMAWASARSTVYTLTNKRLVLRKGMAVPKCFNLPLKLVVSADLKPLGRGHGDLALTMGGGTRFPYLLLWPHARPWHFKSPKPMLRSVPDAEALADRLVRACAAIAPIERSGAAAPAVSAPAPGISAVHVPIGAAA